MSTSVNDNGMIIEQKWTTYTLRPEPEYAGIVGSDVLWDREREFNRSLDAIVHSIERKEAVTEQRRSKRKAQRAARRKTRIHRK